MQIASHTPYVETRNAHTLDLCARLIWLYRFGLPTCVPSPFSIPDPLNTLKDPMSDMPSSVKPKIPPGDPIDPRPGYGRMKPHFLLASLVSFGLAVAGTIHFAGGILLGILFLIWAVDNEYFDYA